MSIHKGSVRLLQCNHWPVALLPMPDAPSEAMHMGLEDRLGDGEGECAATGAEDCPCDAPQERAALVGPVVQSLETSAADDETSLADADREFERDDPWKSESADSLQSWNCDPPLDSY